jgi:hypothetical protein
MDYPLGCTNVACVQEGWHSLLWFMSYLVGNCRGPVIFELSARFCSLTLLLLPVFRSHACPVQLAWCQKLLISSIWMQVSPLTWKSWNLMLLHKACLWLHWMESTTCQDYETNCWLPFMVHHIQVPSWIFQIRHAESYLRLSNRHPISIGCHSCYIWGRCPLFLKWAVGVHWIICQNSVLFSEIGENPV